VCVAGVAIYRRRRGEGHRKGCPLPGEGGIPSHQSGGFGERRAVAPTGQSPGLKTTLVHFICHKTHLAQEKFSLLFANYSDTNKPKIRNWRALLHIYIYRCWEDANKAKQKVINWLV